MSRNSTWKRDANGFEHPTHETLLAFIREQCVEQEKIRVSDHLLAGCASCHRLQAIFIQDSSALNQLNHMARYLYYPELQSRQIWSHMQRGEPLTSVWTGKRKRKFQAQSRPAGRQLASSQHVHRTGLRVFRLSFPVAFGLLLIFTTVAIVLAYTIASFVKFPFNLPGLQPSNNFYTPASSSSSFSQHHLTPTNTALVTITPTPSVSATVGDSPTPTVTVTGRKGPAIDYCPRHDHWGQIIIICGYGFKAGDKVSLVLDLYGKNKPAIWGPFWVDKHGEFTGWSFYSCKNPPLAIYARDETLATTPVLSNTLTVIPVADCNGPTPTPTPGGHS